MRVSRSVPCGVIPTVIRFAWTSDGELIKKCLNSTTLY
jgi:hypothetical protein